MERHSQQRQRLGFTWEDSGSGSRRRQTRMALDCGSMRSRGRRLNQGQGQLIPKVRQSAVISSQPKHQIYPTQSRLRVSGGATETVRLRWLTQQQQQQPVVRSLFARMEQMLTQVEWKCTAVQHVLYRCRSSRNGTCCARMFNMMMLRFNERSKTD